jgi:uncharacterized protein
MEALTNEPEVRKYVMLASKIRKNELTLTPEQAPQFQKLANSVAPALKAIAKVSLEVKAAETQQNAAELLAAQLVQQRQECTGLAQVSVAMVAGETALRSMKYDPDGSTLYDLPAKEIKSRLRGNTSPSEPISSVSSGKIVWQSK